MVIVDSGSRHLLVRLVAHGIVGGLGCVMFFLALLAAFWMRAEGSVELAPIVDRLLVGGFLSVLALALIAAAIGYGLRYVAWMAVEDGQLRIMTLSPLGWHRIGVPASDFRLGLTYAPMVRHKGRLIDAPWMTFTLKGKPFPFMIDLQSTHIDHQALGRINPRTE